MANVPMDEMLRRAVDLNVRYYSAVGKLASEYIKDLVTAVTDISASQASAATSTKTAASPAPSPQRSASAQMVLEAPAGEKALGVFLVENSLPTEVKASVVAGTFTAESGKHAKVKFEFDPSAVSLRAGEQVLVRVQAQIVQDMPPDVRFYGEFLIPAIQGTRIPVVLRRRPKT